MNEGLRDMSNSSPLFQAHDANRTLVCMGAQEVAIALVLVILIIGTLFGNIMIILSVVLYRRMQSFTNVLLTSLASSDLLVGILVMPLATVYLIENQWRLGDLICHIWATVDVLLCTASILNLCVVSLDRFFAISWPLLYIRNRSKKLAGLLIIGVWCTSFVICMPPWFVSTWGFAKEPQECGYVKTMSYRVYSACGSFYLPLLVMLFVYCKIFQATSRREKMLQLGKRGSQLQMHRGGQRFSAENALGTALSVLAGVRAPSAEDQNTEIPRLAEQRSSDWDVLEDGGQPHKTFKNSNSAVSFTPRRRGCSEDDMLSSRTPSNQRTPDHSHSHSRLMRQATNYYMNSKPMRGSQEKSLYMKERKALKTIGIIVSGFVGCWLPFFVMYILEGACPKEICTIPSHLSNFCLWLGYSNSVLNPLIYALYNRDFKRCFRDLLSGGCLRKKIDRRMSVKRLHQVRM